MVDDVSVDCANHAAFANFRFWEGLGFCIAYGKIDPARARGASFYQSPNTRKNTLNNTCNNSGYECEDMPIEC